MRRRPEAITRDQEFYSAILDQLRSISEKLSGIQDAIADGLSGGPGVQVRCEVCGRTFKNDWALTRHSVVHKESDGIHV